METLLTRHTKDNLRCLLAVTIILAGSIGTYLVQRTQYPSAPAWIPVAISGALVVLVTILFSLRRVVPERVSADETRVVRTLPDGTSETVRWDDLKEVVLVTTDRGPEAGDVYWMLVGYTGGCAVAGGAIGMKQFRAQLRRLPRFSRSAVIRAMTSRRNGSFVCWRRDA